MSALAGEPLTSLHPMNLEALRIALELKQIPNLNRQETAANLCADYCAEGNFEQAELYARVRDHLWAARFRIGGGDS